MSDNRVRFSQFRWSGRLGRWITETSDPASSEFSMLHVSDLVGKTVNIGDKDGGVWDAVTVTEFDETTGYLTLEGGQLGSAFGRAEPRPLERAHALWAHDVARGYIHE